jgi:hypothetical protein
MTLLMGLYAKLPFAAVSVSLLVLEHGRFS